MTGLIFPGRNEEPACTAGSVISAIPTRGPLASSRRSLDIFARFVASALNVVEMY